MARDYDEKRDFIRVSVDCDIHYTPEGGEEKIGKVSNLSGRGMMFITEEEIPAESMVEIKIMPEANVTPPLHAMVRIVRVAKQRRADGYEIGAVIQSILEDD